MSWPGPAAGQGGSSFHAEGQMPPPQPSAPAAEPVEAKVIDIEIEQKKFTVIQPSVPDRPGKFAPYPTSDIRRAMNRPSCSVVQQPGREEQEVIVYGYFWNKEKNIENFFGAHGVGESEVPPFEGTQNYISLRASPKECLDLSIWGKVHKEYVFDRDLLFYRMRFPKQSYTWLFQQKFIKECGKGGGKQWIHLQKKYQYQIPCHV